MDMPGCSISDQSVNLASLPVDALLYVFKFCHISDLCSLSRVCKRFNTIIDDIVWTEKCRDVLITNQLSEIVKKRSMKILHCRERCRISKNWISGIYRTSFQKSKTRYIPWLLLESDQLWVSRGCDIALFKRHTSGLKTGCLKTLRGGHSDDICRFVKQNDNIFSGGCDGRLCCWSANSGQLLFSLQGCHSNSIQAVDAHEGILASGSRDSSVKVWRLEDDSPCRLQMSVDVGDRVWCVAICPSGSVLGVGSAGYRGVPSLCLLDLNSSTPLMDLNCTSLMRNGAAVYDICWESPCMFLTCGFDSCLRLWDLRTSHCVGEWPDPFDGIGYCLATDKLFSVVCGIGNHSRIQLWDKRMKYSIQSFFSRKFCSGPVFSLDFDPCQLFIAETSSITVLDFSGHQTTGKDYSIHLNPDRRQ